MKIKKISKSLFYLIFAGLFIYFVTTVNTSKNNLESINTEFKGAGMLLRQELKYQQEKTMDNGKYNFKAEFKTPVDATVQISTLSAESVGVTNVYQEGEKTYIVIEPIDKNIKGKK